MPPFSSHVDLDAITEQLTHHDSVNLCDLSLFSRSLATALLVAFYVTHCMINIRIASCLSNITARACARANETLNFEL